MRLICDADVLIKLAVSGVKEAVVSHLTLVMPPSVKAEAVDEGLARGFPDAAVLAANLAEGKLSVCPRPARAPEAALFGGGEEEVVSAFLAGGYVALASEDERVLRKLRALGVPVVTSPTIVLLLVTRRVLGREQGRTLLERLRPWVSPTEYALVMGGLGG